MDENFQTYLNRAMRMTLPETYRSQVQHIQDSPKYQRHAELGLEALPFPGYTIVSPPGLDDSAENQVLFPFLERIQQQLLKRLGPEVFAPVPSASFHLTLADLIWDSAYKHAIDTSDQFEVQLRDCIAQIFQSCDGMQQGMAIQFQVLGLMVMTRAIGVCLAPTDEGSYERILRFRRALYQNRELIGLGIEQQYYFTPHVTLGYFGTTPPIDKRATLAEDIIDLNQEWLDSEPQMFWVSQAELRKFDDMTRYYRESDWPVFQF